MDNIERQIIMRRNLFLLSLALLTVGLGVKAQQLGPDPGAADTTLDFYLGQALRNSPLLKDYHNQVLAGQMPILTKEDIKALGIEPADSLHH